jgi:SAM-dependent methyltransferase
LTGKADYDRLWTNVYGDMQGIGPTHRHMRRLVQGLLGGLRYRTVLDVGCGAGDNIALLTGDRELDRFVGIDVSPKALERARRAYPAGDYVALDIERERLDQRFDLVFSSLLLEHLSDDDIALRNLRAMTGGHLVLTTIAGDFERYRAWDEQVGHVRNYRPGELERKLGDAGFDVGATIYWGFPFYSPLARRLQNRASPSAAYGRGARLLAALLYRLYFLNSARRGDLLIAVAMPRSPLSATPTIDSSRERPGE